LTNLTQMQNRRERYGASDPKPYCNRASTGAHAMDARVFEHVDKCRKRPD
jgi:hypothetical protein